PDTPLRIRTNEGNSKIWKGRGETLAGTDSRVTFGKRIYSDYDETIGSYESPDPLSKPRSADRYQIKASPIKSPSKSPKQKTEGASSPAGGAMLQHNSRLNNFHQAPPTNQRGREHMGLGSKLAFYAHDESEEQADTTHSEISPSSYNNEHHHHPVSSPQ
ncbi:unnamed protein product, partial [Heterosigma akashiwo]